MKRAIAGLLIALMPSFGCGSLPPLPPCVVDGTCPTPPPTPTPAPTPTPTPTPPPMLGKTCIELGAPCDCIDFPPPGTPTCVVCVRDANGGIIGVKNIGSVPLCPPFVPPTPQPTPTPTPGPTPPPGSGCSIPLGVDWQILGPPSTTHLAKIDEIQKRITGCEVNSRCVIPYDQQTYQSIVIAEAKKSGLCAGQHLANSDQIAVGSLASPHTGIQIYGCPGVCDDSVPCAPDNPSPQCKLDTCRPGCIGGTVRWAPGSIHDTNDWVSPTPLPTPTPIPTPRPTPPPTSGCTSVPTPDANTGVIHCSVKPANQNLVWCDWTPKINDRDWCPQWGNPQAMVVCPLRPEGHPERRACDYTHGLPTWIGAVPDEGDPFHATAGRGAKVKVITAGGAEVEVTTP